MKPLRYGRGLEKRAMLSGSHHRSRDPMTVCIAALFDWRYGEKDFGRAVIAVSDRMLTAGDIEYEPENMKVCFINRNVIVLTAGDVAVHSEALAHLMRRFPTKSFAKVEEVAAAYGEEIQAVRLRRASAEYLAPLGLDTDSFHAKQKMMLPDVVYDITNGLKSYPLSIEAIVTGCDEGADAHVFTVNDRGVAISHDDIGFAAIGLGGAHASSQFMFSRYRRNINYFDALPIIYAARRRAEVAPGVGKTHDFLIATRGGWEPIRPKALDALEGCYEEFDRAVMDMYAKATRSLFEVYADPPKAITDETPPADEKPSA